MENPSNECSPVSLNPLGRPIIFHGTRNVIREINPMSYGSPYSGLIFGGFYKTQYCVAFGIFIDSSITKGNIFRLNLRSRLAAPTTSDCSRVLCFNGIPHGNELLYRQLNNCS